MANRRIKDMTAEGTVQSTDVVALDRTGYAETHKITVDDLTALEETARAAQDDVIEAGAGLDAAGTYTATATSWYLKAADFAAGTTDSGGATGALTASLKNADRLLDGTLRDVENRLTTVENTYFTKEVTLNHGDILSSNSAPVLAIDFSTEIVTAGRAVHCYAAEIKYDFAAGAYATNTDLEIYSENGGEVQMIATGILANGTAKIAHFDNVTGSANSIVSDDDIYIRTGTGDPTGGNVANSATVFLHCFIINVS